MRRKRFLQIAGSAISIFTIDRSWQNTVKAQDLLSFPKRPSSGEGCSNLIAGKIDRIVGDGITSEVQLLRLLQL